MENRENIAVKETDEKENKAKTDTADTKEEKTAEKADDKKTEKKTDAEAEEKEPDAEADEDGEDGEVNTDDLFKHRESLDLTPENAVFSLSGGGMVSLKITNPNGEEEEFERVVIRRSFPLTAPDEFLSVREPDTKEKGRGSEIGMIRNINLFPEDAKALINAELNMRYFTPTISKILSTKEKLGNYFWEMETSAGTVSIVIVNPFGNIRKLEDGRIMIFDIDGNCFVIPDPEKLDKQSYKYIEVYI